MKLDPLESLILAAFVVVMALILYAGLKRSAAETFELVTHDWECTEEHSETHLQPMLVGKVTIMQPITRTVCDRWERRK